MATAGKLAIQMLADRVLVQLPASEGERKSRSGILIPATAEVAKRLAWAEVMAVGPHVRTVKTGDRVLFNPEDRFEVEVQGDDSHPAGAGHPRGGVGAHGREHRPVPVGAVPTALWSVPSRSMPSMPVATPIALADDDLAQVRFNAEGLVPAIVQEQGTGEVLMLAWMNLDALQRTLTTGRTWFWSRSRQEYWCKGETSGDRQWVREAFYDCDGDTLLIVVEQEGNGACHTGAHTCFFRPFGAGASTSGT